MITGRLDRFLGAETPGNPPVHPVLIGRTGAEVNDSRELGTVALS
jgi:hypothetical protein